MTPCSPRSHACDVSWPSCERSSSPDAADREEARPTPGRATFPASRVVKRVHLPRPLAAGAVVPDDDAPLAQAWTATGVDGASGWNGCISAWSGPTTPYVDSGTSFQTPATSPRGSETISRALSDTSWNSCRPGYSARSVGTSVV